jgi:hypothetical protein
LRKQRAGSIPAPGNHLQESGSDRIRPLHQICTNSHGTRTARPTESDSFLGLGCITWEAHEEPCAGTAGGHTSVVCSPSGGAFAAGLWILVQGGLDVNGNLWSHGGTYRLVFSGAAWVVWSLISMIPTMGGQIIAVIAVVMVVPTFRVVYSDRKRRRAGR